MGTVSLGVLGVMGAAQLSITGIFGMAAYSVSRRLKELGIRMALGEFCYSVRRALIGSMEAARVAGIIAAIKAQIASEPIAPNNASGSHLAIP